jgi:hypothetical protein
MKMNRSSNWNRRLVILALVMVLAVTGLVSSVMAQDSTPAAGVVVAGGFNGPQGILVTRNGLWVIDSGVGGINEVSAMDPNTGEVVTAKVGNTSRVMQVQPDGKQTEISKLPSVVAGTDTTGGARLVILNGVLYATSGIWVQAAQHRGDFGSAQGRCERNRSTLEGGTSRQPGRLCSRIPSLWHGGWPGWTVVCDRRWRQHSFAGEPEDRRG